MVTGSFWFIRDAILVGFITKYGSQQAINRSAGCGLLFVAVDVALRHFFFSADSADAETFLRRESIGSYSFLSSAPAGAPRVEGGPLMQIAEVARSITG